MILLLWPSSCSCLLFRKSMNSSCFTYLRCSSMVISGFFTSELLLRWNVFKLRSLYTDSFFPFDMLLPKR